MRHILQCLMLAAACGCTASTQSKAPDGPAPAAIGQHDPWLAEERWGIGSVPNPYSLPREGWSPDQRAIHETIDETSYEFLLLLGDEAFPLEFSKSQARCDQLLRDALNGRDIPLEEEENALYQLKSLSTRRFREAILAEDHTLPVVGDQGWYYDDANEATFYAFTDLLYRCPLGGRLYRIASIDVQGDSALAFVEIREGGLDDRDTIIDGKTFGLPTLLDGRCPPLRFEMVRRKGRWLVDNRTIQD